jgi:hypothetical protein
MRNLGILLGVLTFIAGIAIIPEGIAGVFRNIGSAADLGKGLGNIIALLLVFSVAYILISSDGFYRRHPRLAAAGGAIAAIGGLGIITAAFLHPAFQEASLGASFAAFFAFLAGLLALADAAVVFIRCISVMNRGKRSKIIIS